MKSEGFKALFSMSVTVAILCLPLLAVAESIPWSYEQYQVLASIYETNDVGDMLFQINDEKNGPPLPITANVSYDSGTGSYATASSTMSNSSMSVQVNSHESIRGYGMYADASSNFNGKYVASKDYFQFTYNSNASAPLIYLYVIDETEGIEFHNRYFSGSGVITIPTKQGHDIIVQSWISLDAPNSPAYSVSADYSMTETSVLPPDVDKDGVLNENDLCNSTPFGVVVDPSNGCSIDQLNPCAGSWKNHSDYLLNVIKTAKNFLDKGLITQQERAAIVAEAGKFTCGK